MKRKEFGNVLHCLGQWLHFFGKKIFNRKAEHIIKYFKDNSRYVRYDPPVEIGWEGVGYTIWQNGCWQRVKGYLEKRINFCAGIYCGLIKGEQTDVCSDAIAFRQDLCDKAKQIVDNDFVGVHIRRTDHLAAIRESTLDIFIERMKEAISHKADTQFFLATDDKSVEEELRRVFPNRIHTYEDKIWGRESKNGMESAIVDCLCLSRCEYILGSYQSVFSKFAALYGNKELIVCKK